MAKKDEILISLTAQEKGLKNLIDQVSKFGETLNKLKFGSLSNIGKALGEINKRLNSIQMGTLSKLGKQMVDLTKKVEANNAAIAKAPKHAKDASMAFLHLGEGIKGYIKGVENMISVQLRWYGARFVSQAILEAPIAGALAAAKYSAELDEARANMLRWEATSGKVTADSIAGVDAIMNQIRRSLLELPLSLKDASESVQAVVGAGLSSGIVSTMVPDILRLKNAFKEIEFEPFTIAIVGAFNVFKDQIGQGLTEAEKFRRIFEMLLRAQAQGVIRPEQFQKVFQYMAGIGEISGMTLEQLLAVSVALTDTGSLAANASRMLRSLLIALPQEKATAGFRALGITLKEDIPIMEQFKDVAAGIIKVVGQTGAVDVSKFRALGDIAAPEQLKTLIDLARNWHKVGDLQADIKGSVGGLISASDVVAKNLKAQWQIFLNTLNEVHKGILETPGTNLSALMAVLVDVTRGMLFATDVTGKFSDKIHLLGTAGKFAYESFSVFLNIIKGMSVVIGAVFIPIKEITKLLADAFTFWSSSTKTFGQLIASYIVASFASWLLTASKLVAVMGSLITLLRTGFTVTALQASLAAVGGYFGLVKTAILAAVFAYLKWEELVEKKEGTAEIERAKIKALTNTPEENKAAIIAQQEKIDALRSSIQNSEDALARIGERSISPRGGKLRVRMPTEADKEDLAILKKSDEIPNMQQRLYVEERILSAYESSVPKPEIKKTEKKPGPFVPELHPKEFGAEDFTNVRKRYAALYESEMRDERNQLRLLSDQHKIGVILTEDYEKQRIDIAEKYRVIKVDLLHEEAKEMMEAFNKSNKDLDAQYAKKPASKEADIEKVNAKKALSERLIAEQEILAKKLNDVDDKASEENSAARRDAIIRDMDLNRKLAESQRSMAEDALETQLAFIREEVETKKNLYSDMYNRNEIGASQYYSFVLTSIDEEASRSKEMIDQRLALLREQLATEKDINKQKENALKYDEAYNKAANEKVLIDKRSAEEKSRTELSIKRDIKALYEMRAVYDDLNEYGRGFLNVSQYAVDEFVNKFTNTAQHIYDIWSDMAQGMSQTFQDFFIDAIEGKLKSLGDYVNSFLKSVYSSIAAALGQQTAGAVLSAVKIGAQAYFGAPVSSPSTPINFPGEKFVLHSGGKVVSYHGGGEVEAKLLTGERVMSREQSSMFESLAKNQSNPNIEINIVNQSSSPVTAQQGPIKFELDKLITTVVLKDLQNNGPIRKSLRG